MDTQADQPEPGSQTDSAVERRIRRAAALSALGEPVRLGIVDLLQVQDLSPDVLAETLGIPGNLLSHHLKVLETAGIVTRSHSQNDRRRTYAHLIPSALEGLLPEPTALTTARMVFVCTHNSARSVMAQAAWRSVSDVPSASAGTDPADRINPRAQAALERVGLRPGQRVPLSVDAVLRPDDLVVSVCDSVNEQLGPLPNQRIHWSVPDPAAIDTDEAFGHTLDDLHHRVTCLAPLVRRA